ncbi:putative Forkhead box protein N1 [Hypsibius exemplaris]|uniref:Forkhead box protein N1 n=1 Tax=Hypsibius exemplaris TaxID=2072580 RepID=A0A1W0X8P5_HYPEX|nr:putative Forkhead box protein N1 [Hypsibius exemplaris]
MEEKAPTQDVILVQPTPSSQQSSLVADLVEHKLSEAEVMDQLAVMYDLYGLHDLGDLGEISFSLLDSSPDGSISLRLNTSARLTAPQEPRQDLSCNFATRQDRHQVSAGTSNMFAYPKAQVPEKLMYEPMQYTVDHLAFPEYMMVHQSGMPALISDPSPVPNGAVSYCSSMHVYQSIRRESDTLLRQELPLPSTGFSRIVSHQAPSSLRTRRTELTNWTEFAELEQQSREQANSLPSLVPRKRGRPRKERSSIKPLPSRSYRVAEAVEEDAPLEEKENLPCIPLRDRDEVGSLASGEEEEGQDIGSTFEEPLAGTFPKPPYSYSALVTLALKNSKTGRLTVRDIYNFMCNHFPYFRTAPAGWKNSVRHNLSLNPAFLKILGDTGPARARTACRWTMNPERYRKMNDEIGKFRGKALFQILSSMRNSELLKSLEEGTFSDFGRAVRDVPVQEKKAGHRRRAKKRKDIAVVEPRVSAIQGILNSARDDSRSSFDGSIYQSFSCVAPAKPRSPLAVHPSSPCLGQRAFTESDPLNRCKVRRVLEGAWGEGFDPSYPSTEECGVDRLPC